MRSFIVIIITSFVLGGAAFSAERKTIFEGMGGVIESEVDSMTDRKIGLLFIYDGPYYIAIYDHESFTIWPRAEGLIFSDSGSNLIRIGGSRPIRLVRASKRGGLTTSNKLEAAKIIRSLVNSEEIKFRYEEFPSDKVVDTVINNKAAGFLYSKASSAFGWKNLGQSSAPPLAEVSPYISKDDDGYFAVSVSLNNDIQLTRGFKKYNHESVYVEFGWPGRVKAFGYNPSQKNWQAESDILNENKEIIVRDKDGNITFQVKSPPYNRDKKEITWPEGEGVAKATWKAAPMGTLEIKSSRTKSISNLYGFREVWRWGVENAGLSKIED